MDRSSINKTLLYEYDPEETYTYNIKHGTEYPYNGFPKGEGGRVFKKTRFIDWYPKPDDIIIRYNGKQMVVMFHLLWPNENDVIDPAMEIFQMRSKRSDVQNRICEQINFFCALYDDDNELLSNMLVAKYIVDSQTYTIETIKELYAELYKTLFSGRILEKIRKMTEENDVGDVTIGLFHPEFLRDMFMLAFMIKVMHIYLEHFIKLTGNSPRDQYELFAECYIYMMDQLNENMHPALYQYINKAVAQSIKSNSNIYDMQAMDGITAPTVAHTIIRKTLLADSLIKLSYASTWDPINKRPVESCVGFISSVVNRATGIIRRKMLRFALVNIDDPAQLISDAINNSSPISVIRSFNPGEFTCMNKDLNAVIAHIAMEIDLSPLDFYLTNLPQMNELSKLLVDTVLYNLFHSSISTNTLNNKQKYIVLLYVRYLIMELRLISEEETVSNPLINILMAKTMTTSTKTLTKKEVGAVNKFIKLNNLKEYLLGESNVTKYVESIQNCILNSYTIVNHNNPDLLGASLVYESSKMTQDILDIIVDLFEFMKSQNTY
jgi:hypothetical protein